MNAEREGGAAAAMPLAWLPVLPLLVHGAFGFAVALAILTISSLGLPCVPCVLQVLYPVAGYWIGRRLPRGSPGASLAVAATFWFRFPSDAGPTAKSLDAGFMIIVVMSMVLAELLGGVDGRNDQSRRTANGGDEPSRPAS